MQLVSMVGGVEKIHIDQSSDKLYGILPILYHALLRRAFSGGKPCERIPFIPHQYPFSVCGPGGCNAWEDYPFHISDPHKHTTGADLRESGLLYNRI